MSDIKGRVISLRSPHIFYIYIKSVCVLRLVNEHENVRSFVMSSIKANPIRSSGWLRAALPLRRALQEAVSILLPCMRYRHSALSPLCIECCYIHSRYLESRTRQHPIFHSFSFAFFSINLLTFFSPPSSFFYDYHCSL